MIVPISKSKLFNRTVPEILEVLHIYWFSRILYLFFAFWNQEVTTPYHSNSFRKNISPKSKENNRTANNEAQKRRRAKMNEKTHENVCAKDNARHRIKRYIYNSSYNTDSSPPSFNN